MKIDLPPSLDNDPKATWVRSHKTLLRVAGIVLAIALIGLLGYCAKAKAATASFDAPGCTGFTWNPATNMLGATGCASSGGPVDPPPVVTPPPSTDPFAGCPANALKLSPAFGANVIETPGFGNQIMAVRVAPPLSWSSTSTKTTSWVEYGDGPVQRFAVFSTVPCDFSTANALKNGSGQALVSNGPIRFSFTYRNGSAPAFGAALTPGKVYFLNVRNLDPVCSTQTCQMRGAIAQ